MADSVQSALQLLQNGGDAPAPQPKAPDAVSSALNLLSSPPAASGLAAPIAQQPVAPQSNLERQQAAISDMRNRPWGSGLPKLAYDIGGGVTDIASKILPPTGAATLGFGANVLTQAVPSLFSGTMAKEAAAPMVQGAGRYLMKSAVKPTLSDLRSGDAAKAIDTMLEGGFNPTKGGVEAMKSKIADLGDQITEAVGNSTAMINKNAVASRLNDALSKFSMQVNPQSDTGAIEKAWTEFLNHPLLAGKSEMTVPVAQAMKQATYKALGDKPYGELSGASTEAQKALARGLKEEISKAVPSVADLNAQQGALMNARDIAERRALLESNKNPMGLSLLAKNPMAALGFMADRSALVKALLARMLYSNAGAATGGLGMAGGAALLAGQPPALAPQGALYQK